MIGFVFSEMWQGLRRNASMVISVVLVTFVSLTFVGVAILLQRQIDSMKSYWYDRAQVAVDFCTEVSNSAKCNKTKATPEQIAAVEEQLKGEVLSPYINQYYFEDQDQAYANFLDQFEGDPITSYVKPEYLHEAFWVNLHDPSQSDVLVEQLSNMPGVESVVDQRRFLDGIFNALNVASLTAIGIAVIMLIAAVLLIATTIRLSAFSRRRELSIMRLVGASNRLIQAPFILESIVAALIGSLLASAAIFAIVQFFVRGFLAEQMIFTSFVGLADAALITPILILIAIVLSGLAGWIAISRYLRV